MGLSYNAGTTAFTGTNPLADGPNNYVVSSSIMNTILANDELTAPYFALAISRDQSNTGYGGVFTIGTLPDLTDPRVNASANPVSQLINPGAYEYTSHSINADIAYGTGQQLGASISGGASYLVDSGTTLLDIPAEDAAAFNALWDPPCLSQSGGACVVDCAATPANFAVVVAGVAFEVNPLDLVREVDGTCYSSITSSLVGYSPILGDVFLRNVLAVFDWGDHSMQ